MDPRNVKQAARAALAGGNYDPKKLALIHTGVVIAFSLITSLLSFLLEMGMDSAGGLSGLALRSALGSAQVVLSLAGVIVLPFWQIGMQHAALLYSRNEPVSPKALPEGFRRFGPVLRLHLLLMLVILGVSMVSTYVSSAIFAFSPLSDGMYAAIDNLLATTDVTAITEEMIMEVIPHTGWLVVLNFVVMLLIGLPILYRYRMSQFALMNGAPGAMAAVRESALLSRGRRMAMFKFDLSFWWYYAIQLLIAAVAYLDMLLPALGITLPVSADGLYWITFGIYAVASLLFYRQWEVYYQTACAKYYQLLRDNPLFPMPPKQQ